MGENCCQSIMLMTRARRLSAVIQFGAFLSAAFSCSGQTSGTEALVLTFRVFLLFRCSSHNSDLFFQRCDASTLRGLSGGRRRS